MKKKYRISFFFICISFFLTKDALAYLDPGTGSIILQAIIAAIATASDTITFYWKKIKNKIKNIFSKKNKDLSEK